MGSIIGRHVKVPVGPFDVLTDGIIVNIVDDSRFLIYLVGRHEFVTISNVVIYEHNEPIELNTDSNFP